MTIRCFWIPAADPGMHEDALNKFLQSHRVVATDWRFVENGTGSAWAVRVTIAGGDGPLPDCVKAESNRTRPMGSKVDYRDVLSPEDFAIYAALREWRKEQAAAMGVPVFAVLGNEQLATVVTSRATTLVALRAIDGIGDAKIEKFGDVLINRLRTILRERGADTIQVTEPGPKDGQTP